MKGEEDPTRKNNTKKHGLSHGMCLCMYQVMMALHFLNANGAESTKKNENYVIIASLKSETITMGKLINRIPGSRLLISRISNVC